MWSGWTHRGKDKLGTRQPDNGRARIGLVMSRLLPPQVRIGLQLLRRRAYRGGWIGGYLRSRHQGRSSEAIEGPIDVIVAIVDHFEPARRFGDPRAVQSVEEWCAGYEKIASQFRDADGRYPQHTWFYRAEYPNFGCIRALSESCWRGFGEIEFHLHHGFDDHQSFSAKLADGVRFFRQVGAMKGADPSSPTRFAYIAGNWALDNGARDPAKSGCDTELTALRDAGCYADFTFPAIGSHAQPQKVNAIYYATDTPAPKSYDNGVDVQVGRPASGDLMIVQGPLTLNLWRDSRRCRGRRFCPTHANPARSLAGTGDSCSWAPEWLFVKLHCHGMQSRRTFHGEGLSQTFQAMVDRWNRPPYRLHFVNAPGDVQHHSPAEAGHSGDAGEFRDFEIPPPANRFLCADRPWRLVRFNSRNGLEVETHSGIASRLGVRLHDHHPIFLSGSWQAVAIDRSGDGWAFRLKGPERVTVSIGETTRFLGPGETMTVPLNPQQACRQGVPVAMSCAAASLE